MARTFTTKEDGRTAFGLDPAGYHSGRPEYPEWVFETLRDRCGLGPGTEIFELGAGSGTATRRLLEAGPRRLTAIEPDRRLADFLSKTLGGRRLTVLEDTFEAVELEVEAYDLGISATAFHWVDEDQALAKIARSLRPGGWWAAVWNVFGDSTRPDPFHEATRELLQDVAPLPKSERGLEFALDADARISAIEKTGRFDEVTSDVRPWTLTLTAEETVALYATFSTTSLRADREAVLAELGRIARDEFGGRVVRNMTTSLYIGRRK